MTHHGRIITCRSCGEQARNRGHGYCESCYYRQQGHSQGRRVVCRSCGKQARNRGHGYCESCYDRWCRHGRPDLAADQFVPYQVPRAADRIVEYAEHAAAGLSRQQAAWRMDVSTRTIDRYIARLRDAGYTPLDLLAEQEAFETLDLDDVDDDGCCDTCGFTLDYCGCVDYRGRRRRVDDVQLVGGLL